MKDTFLLPLPDGKKVPCWTREKRLLLHDLSRHGTVYLVGDPATGVYSRIDPDSVEATVLNQPRAARHIG